MERKGTCAAQEVMDKQEVAYGLLPVSAPLRPNTWHTGMFAGYLTCFL